MRAPRSESFRHRCGILCIIFRVFFRNYLSHHFLQRLSLTLDVFWMSFLSMWGSFWQQFQHPKSILAPAKFLATLFIHLRQIFTLFLLDVFKILASHLSLFVQSTLLLKRCSRFDFCRIFNAFFEPPNLKHHVFLNITTYFSTNVHVPLILTPKPPLYFLLPPMSLCFRIYCEALHTSTYLHRSRNVKINLVPVAQRLTWIGLPGFSQ